MVNDLGGLPPSHQDLTLTEFQSLLDSMPSLRMMTISPHLDTANNYLRIQALVNRSPTDIALNDAIPVSFSGLTDLLLQNS